MIEPNTTVILIEAPPSLMEGLPEEDQRAIQSAVGREVLFVGFDERDYAELEFEYVGDIHTIWVEAKYIQEAGNESR